MKILIRHSLRPSLQGVINPDLVTLSIQGKEMAYKFGENLPYPIRHCYSSYVPRCIQTIEYILMGAEQSKEIVLKGCLSDDVFTDKNVASTYIREMSLKKSVFDICSPHSIPQGFKDIKSCGKMLLDCIFNDNDSPHSIDIYCSHDYQLAILVTLMFNNNVSVDTITELWPEMLEYLWFYGKRDDFYCVWRNEKRQFWNYMM